MNRPVHSQKKKDVTTPLAKQVLPDSYTAHAQKRLQSQDLIFFLGLGTLIQLCLAAFTGIPLLHALLGTLIFIAGGFAYRKSIQAGDIDSAFTPKFSISETVRQGEARLADGFAEAVVIIGQQHQVTYANPAAQAMLGIERPGQALATFVRNPAVIDMIHTVMGGNRPHAVTYHVETPVDRHFRTYAAPINSLFDNEPPIRALVVFYDITDIVRANDLRSDFLANASHELKTPVASLLGYIETLRGHARNDPDARERFLVIMQEQAERMQRLINDLLSLRRIELTQHLAPTDTTNFYASIQTALETVAPLLNARKVTIDYTGPQYANVIGIADDIVQLVLNLVENAIQISPPDSVVNLDLDLLLDWTPGEEFSETALALDAPRRRINTPADPDKSFYRLRIRDSGPGFAREHLPRLGERFYRIAGDRKNKDRGTGLGLAIVKHICRRHRGGFYVESAQDVGTEFIITLPAILGDD